MKGKTTAWVKLGLGVEGRRCCCGGDHLDHLRSRFLDEKRPEAITLEPFLEPALVNLLQSIGPRLYRAL